MFLMNTVTTTHPTYATPKCCARPGVATMDHVKGYHGDTKEMVSRVCLKCGTHWYGEAGNVREYSRREWDAWINSALEETA